MNFRAFKMFKFLRCHKTQTHKQLKRHFDKNVNTILQMQNFIEQNKQFVKDVYFSELVVQKLFQLQNQNDCILDDKFVQDIFPNIATYKPISLFEFYKELSNRTSCSQEMWQIILRDIRKRKEQLHKKDNLIDFLSILENYKKSQHYDEENFYWISICESLSEMISDQEKIKKMQFQTILSLYNFYLSNQEIFNKSQEEKNILKLYQITEQKLLDESGIDKNQIILGIYNRINEPDLKQKFILCLKETNDLMDLMPYLLKFVCQKD